MQNLIETFIPFVQMLNHIRKPNVIETGVTTWKRDEGEERSGREGWRG